MKNKNEETSEDSLNCSVSFSGIDKKIVTNSFKGGKIEVKFGGARIDLSNAKIKDKGSVNLEVEIIGGGLKLIVPPAWSIQESVKNTAGGFHNAAKPPKGKEEGTLILKGKITFGGLEVSNDE